MNKNKLIFEATATFIGTVIGAGILGIPYVVAQAGLWTGLLVILAIGIISGIIYLYLGETVLRTKGKHQLTGYAYKYLGKNGRNIMALSMMVGIYGAMVAYIIGEGRAIAAIFGLQGHTFSIFGFIITAEIIFSVLFFFFVSIIVYEGIKAVGKSEMYLLPIMLGVIIIMCMISVFYIKPENITGFNMSRILLPYGVILFAFLGATALPEMQQELGKNLKLMKKSILLGVLIPIIIYAAFAFAIVGVSGKNTTEVATIGLGEAIGPYMILFGNIFAIFAMATSFLALGLALQQMYEYDYNFKRSWAWALTCIPPLMVALSGVTSFVGIITLGGVIAGGIDGVIIVLMAHKAKKLGNRKPEFSIPVNWLLSALLIMVFLLGAGYYFTTLVF